jgi:Flp pilus assembly protein TadG
MAMTQTRFDRKRDRQRGAAVVELAVVLPVFAYLLLACIELTLNFFYRNAMADAARGAARAGSVYSASGGEDATTPATTTANAYLSRMWVGSPATVTATVDTSTNNLSVTISRPRFKLVGAYPRPTLTVTETLPLP